MEKIVNLLKSSDNEFSKFATKKWCVDSQTKDEYSHHNPTNFLTFRIFQIFVVILVLIF